MNTLTGGWMYTLTATPTSAAALRPKAGLPAC
ncbi:hypothetical protein ABIB14_001584 [Arthrobacter sp. UYEF3]